VSVILTDFNPYSKVLTDFNKTPPVSNFMKLLHRFSRCFIRKGRRTDESNLIGAPQGFKRTYKCQYNDSHWKKRADPTPQTLNTDPCILYRSIYFWVHSRICVIGGLL
jgi:hypothetical protein